MYNIADKPKSTNENVEKSKLLILANERALINVA